MSPFVYIVVLNYNNYEDTIACLKSLEAIPYKNKQVVLVDNASSDDSYEKLAQWLAAQEHTQVTLLQAKYNGGYSAGNNIGIRYALSRGDADFIWVLNNDVIVAIDSLEHLMAFYADEKNKKVGILGAKILFVDAPELIQSAGGGKMNTWLAYPTSVGAGKIDDGSYDQKDIKIDYVSGASMFCPVKFIQEVGLLNEDYFLYFEEMDWTLRGAKLGWEIGYCYQAKVYHKGGASTGGSYRKKTISKLSDFYFQRSRVLFTYNHFPLRLPIIYLSFVLVMLNRIRKGQMNRCAMLVRILINPFKAKFFQS